MSSLTGVSRRASRARVLDGDRVSESRPLRRGVPGESKAGPGRAFEGRPRIIVGKHVARLAPGAAEEEAASSGIVGAPFLDVAGHVVGAERTDPLCVPTGAGPASPKLLTVRMSEKCPARRRDTSDTGSASSSGEGRIGRRLDQLTP